MRTQSRDSSPEVERVLIELIRKAPIAKRFALVISMTTTMTKKIVCLYREQHPRATWSEVAQILGPHLYKSNM